MRSLTITLLCLLICHLISAQSLKESDSLTIIKVVKDQQDAWNKGDIKTFMKGYLPSDKTVFNGSNGPFYGYEQILSRYLRSYPDKDAMGITKMEIDDLFAVNKTAALLLGRFYLTRSSGEISGYFTLVFKKVKGQWFILSDHTSRKEV
ncbi:MAG: YybH family protein [Bacteroidota bacterium]